MVDFNTIYSQVRPKMLNNVVFTTAALATRKTHTATLRLAQKLRDSVVIWTNIQSMLASATCLLEAADLPSSAYAKNFQDLLADYSSLTSLIKRAKNQELAKSFEVASAAVREVREKRDHHEAKVAATAATAVTFHEPRPIVVSARPRLAVQFPTFNGDILQWSSFWSLFSSIINKDDVLDDSEKASQLTDSLKHLRVRICSETTWHTLIILTELLQSLGLDLNTSPLCSKPLWLSGLVNLRNVRSKMAWMPSTAEVLVLKLLWKDVMVSRVRLLPAIYLR